MVPADLTAVAREQGWFNAAALARWVAHAEREEAPLALVLTREGGVAEDTLAEAVSVAIGSVIIDVDLGTLDAEALRIVPEAIARRFLFVPIARADGHLRVAFANPLDSAAVEVLQSFTSLELEPVVATVSGILAVLEREWSGRNTEILPAPRKRELPPEHTRPLEQPSPPQAEGDAWGPDGAAEEWPSADPPAEEVTQIGHGGPVHHIEGEGTPEQRHEALLLSLIEAGVVTRADYTAALRRLLGRDDE